MKANISARASVALIKQHLCFKRAHEGLRPGVVIRIGPGRPALIHPSLGKRLAKDSAAILVAAVAVEDEAMAAAMAAAGCDGLLHGIND